MISIIITAYKEEKTIGKAIQALLDNNLKNFEILVVAPDTKTLSEIKKFSRKDKRIKDIKDSGKGKPAALNLVFKKAKGEILVLTDGDVWIEKNAIKYLLEPFSDPKVGAVSGHPISINSRNKIMGFWSHLLTSVADKRRYSGEVTGKKIKAQL